jgi:predicted DNA-binding transcriptional regulator YafY
MNRTDRLYALREELRRAGPEGRTAEQLAARFEVSARTVKRDVSALQQGGFPVWARIGRIGGYVVDRNATLPPVNITAAEATALAAALASHRGQPFYRDGQAALTKILAVMDEGSRGRAAQLRERIWINDEDDPPPTKRAQGGVKRALHARRVLSIRYRDRDDTRTTRRVDPQVLAHTRGQWYLVAYCRLRQGVRWFRLDRIERATVTAEAACDVPLSDIGQPPPTARTLSESPQRPARPRRRA